MRLNVGARGWLLLIMPLYYSCRPTAIVQLLLLWVLSITRRLLQAAIITRWPTILQCCHGLYQDHASSNMKFQIIKQKWVFLLFFVLTGLLEYISTFAFIYLDDTATLFLRSLWMVHSLFKRKTFASRWWYFSFYINDHQSKLFAVFITNLWQII